MSEHDLQNNFFASKEVQNNLIPMINEEVNCDDREESSSNEVKVDVI